MKFEYNTKIISARPNSNSVRTTIPKEIVKFLDLTEGNSIKWIVEINSDDILISIQKMDNS